MSRAAFYVLFTASGFAGLIYESVWTHYLKLFLGHAAYAQSLVLAVFMGGMAAGRGVLRAPLARASRNPLAAYAIGRGGRRPRRARLPRRVRRRHRLVLRRRCCPRLGNEWLALGAKLALSCLLILPQSVLLGMTFPLMSAGLVRAAAAARAGESVAMLYFTNSLGAAAGVLVERLRADRLGRACPARCAPPASSTSLIAVVVWLLARPARHAALEKQPQTRETDLRLLLARRVLHRPRLVRLRDQLDPHAVAGARRLDAFVRADARHLHPRPRARRPRGAPARRRRAPSRCGCSPGCRWRWGSPRSPRCRCTTSPSR